MNPPTAEDMQLLGVAIAHSTHCLTETGVGPFGAVVACRGKILGAGANLVEQSLDPSAHAEVVAIRAACRTLGTTDLSGCVLYASCEPCPMCRTAAHFAGIRRVHVAATNEDLARAFEAIGQDLWEQHQSLTAAASGDWVGCGTTLVAHQREEAADVLMRWANLMNAAPSTGSGEMTND